MNTSKIIKAYIGAGTYSVTEPITQWDYGYIFQIEGVELPATYRVDFSNNRHKGEALPVYGNEDGAEVPEELIATGKDIFAFYYYIEEGFGKTAYTWKIPNDTRANAGDREPTPTQQDSIDQLIVRSNEAVTSAEQSASAADQSARSASNDADRAERARTGAETARGKAEEAQESAERAKDDAETSERNASESERKAKGYAETASEKADAITGLTATATTLPSGSSATVTLNNGEFAFGIPRGADGDDYVLTEQDKQDIASLVDVADYNGVVSGTTLASNNKAGFYSVGGFSTAVVSHMTDMPCDDFAGGYLLNTYVGSAGTTIKQTLVEIDSGVTVGRTFTRLINRAWFGQGYINWVAFGDSITHGSYSDAQGQTLNDSKHSYAFRIAKNLKHDAVAKFYNCAVRGIGWVNTGNDGETFADMMALFTGDKSAINLVTIMLGINDYLSLETLGTTSSAENDGTISGAIRYGLRYLCENYPNAKIIAISPLNSMNHGTASTGWSRNTRLTLPGTLQDVCDMIAYWCNVYNVTYINEISESFLNNYNMPTYLKDNLHPTDDGQWMLARELSEKIFTGVSSVSSRGGTGGQDGYSPTVTITPITGGHRITITDKDGTETADVMDGTNGTNGTNGQDGYSPTASVSKSGGTATITITDKNGTTTATVSDGANGQNGQNGTDGTDGTTFTPSVSNAGVISWTNDGGKQNPSSVDLVAAIPTATTQAAGKMSATDKGRLDTLYADYSSALTALGVI